MSNSTDSTLFKKINTPINGFIALSVMVLLFILMIPLFVIAVSGQGSLVLLIVACTYWGVIFPFLVFGLRVIYPNEAAVFVLFGGYYGTLSEEGFYFINPFCVMYNRAESCGTNRKVSRKLNAMSKEIKTAKDSRGNTIELGIEFMWHVVDATKAVFEVDDYIDFLSFECDLTTLYVIRKFPRSSLKGGASKSNALDSDEVIAEIKAELQKRVDIIGIEIIEVRIYTIDCIAKATSKKEKTVQEEKTEKPEKVDKVKKTEKTEPAEKADKAEKAGKTTKTSKAVKMDS